MKTDSLRQLSSGQRHASDVLIIGSGAGGAVMAYELARAGYQVTVLEAGPLVSSAEFPELLPRSMELLYQDRGAQTNVDGDINILQGRCVGGSTVVNATAAFRIPQTVLKTWKERYGVQGFEVGQLEPFYRQLEQDLYIHDNRPHEINHNSRLVERGARALGWHVAPLARNVKDCALSGYCIQGCRYDRKQSMLVTYLPWAQRHGARIYADAPVREIRYQNGRAVGVTVEQQGEKWRFDASLVVLSAGAIQSPLLLQDSGLGGPAVGRNFACHPSLGVMAMFDERVQAWQGAQLGVYVDEFSADDRGGFLLEGGAIEPAGFAQAIPGEGLSYEERMTRADRMAGLVTLIHDQGVGIIDRHKGQKRIQYRLSDTDRQRVKAAVLAASRLWFAAGAKEVYLPSLEPTALQPESFESVIEGLSMEPAQWMFSAYHPQGSCRKGVDPADSVVNYRGQLHGMRNLVVADASVFPTSVLVNTQLPTYVTAARMAAYILSDPEQYGLG